ncbi:MAG: ribulose bisphosphate carboxylase small subunit [Phycisphaerae bacterium]|nr:ribulose bisphosphate carboxylase small subunit [Phycisphaerae bacterium]
MTDPDPDADYWLDRSPEERLAEVEACREAFHGTDAVRGRLVRVLEVDDLR